MQWGAEEGGGAERRRAGMGEGREARAKALGADAVINPKKESFLDAVHRLTDGEMIQVSFEAAGGQARAQQSLTWLELGGHAAWGGPSTHLTLPTNGEG